MSRNTSILLGEYFESYVREKVQTGKFNSVSEVIRTALRLFEQEENKVKSITEALEKGEKSPLIQDFNPDEHLKSLHTKHIR